jgi:hypothetical protein
MRTKFSYQLLFLLIICSLVSCNKNQDITTATNGSVNIPDPIFEKYLIDNGVDTDALINHKMSSIDAKKIQSIDINNGLYKNISRLDGIQSFSNLNKLVCVGLQLSSLDISQNLKLEYLYCDENKLTTLNLSNSIHLVSFSCSKNQLSILDISKNKYLQYLNCSYNKFTNLNLYENLTLTILNCNSNLLANLDVSKNTVLLSIDCNNNKLQTLNLCNNIGLFSLNCEKNNIRTIYINSLTKPNDGWWIKDATTSYSICK